MPDLTTELMHLEEAERHIEVARRSLSVIESSDHPSGPSRGHERRLQTLRQTLAAFEAHREQIVRTIEGLRDGSLPAA